MVDALFVGDAMGDRDEGNGRHRMVETLEGEGGWIGGGVEQRSDVIW